MATTVIHAADRILLPTGLTGPGWVEIGRDCITAVGVGAPPRPADLHHAGGLLCPGFVDIHCHGGGGATFADGLEAAKVARHTHRSAGTAATVASLVTASLGELERQCADLAPLVAAGDLAGIHLEGPWLSPKRRGVHDPVSLRNPTVADARALVAAGGGAVRMVTMAPEVPGALEVISYLASEGIVVAIGHSDADEATAARAIEAGATVATHLFNAMRPISHRDPGIVGACLDAGDVAVELIADGVHLAASMVGLAVRASRGGALLVTDAIAAAGQGDGDYTLGGLPIEVRNGVARLAGTDTVAGSTIVLADAVRYAVRVAGVPLEEALWAATARPARALGLFRYGLLVAGTRADLVVLDDDVRVRSVLHLGAATLP